MLTTVYSVIAVPVTIWYNKHQDHDHDGMMYVLEEHKPILTYLKKIQDGTLQVGSPEWTALMAERTAFIQQFGLTDNVDRQEEWFPSTREKAKQPHPLIVPLVLRASKGTTLSITLKNEIPDRKVGLHLVGPGTNAANDGSQIGVNSSSLVKYGQQRTYTWECPHEGAFVFHDAGDFRGDEAGTNTHGLFGALIVEPPGSRWTNPETGTELPSGLYADVHQRSVQDIQTLRKKPFPTFGNSASVTTPYPEDSKASFREFVIFFHDEPHWVPPHTTLETSPCEPETSQEAAQHGHTAGSLMPISYRAEPMISRERLLWKKMKANQIDLSNIVVNEEQHHSSWLFGDPNTPILKAYLGDPVRIRLVHAGVKETHVFHLHVYEWHVVPFQNKTNIVDAVTISPQTGMTIVPLYGAGNRQMVPGDVIWHCHLYPHFHHGMWGIFRTFNTLQEGVAGSYFHGEDGIGLDENDFAKWDDRMRKKLVRQIGKYPDGSPIQALVPLPDRVSPPSPTIQKPGFPLFIAGESGQKSYKVPWHKTISRAITDGWAVNQYDYREPTQLELKAFNSDPRPGELFTTFPHPDRASNVHGVAQSKTVKHDIDVLMTPFEYNDYGWWDPHGHLYALKGHNIKTFSETVEAALTQEIAALKAQTPGLSDESAKAIINLEGLTITPNKREPLFLRCNKTNVMELTLNNRLERYVAATHFDSAWPKGAETGCTQFETYAGECGLHVHIVKFDPIACDGAATGWNYMSAPSMGKKLVYRWWADEEFGVIFTHDHLFANFRQKHGLFGALIVEPENATFHDPKNLSKQIVTGQSAVIKYKETPLVEKAYREFCLGNADWVPLYQLDPAMAPHHETAAPHGQETWSPIVRYGPDPGDQIRVKFGVPIEPPNHPDSHDDNGVFGINYRCEPLHERTTAGAHPADPAEWFSSKTFTIPGEHGAAHQHQFGDPNTPIFDTLVNDPIRLRIVQGSHEEQHSFQVHGMRWRRFWKDPESPLKNQQTLGLSEAFTFDIQAGYDKGDYLWKYSGAEDLWLGCWGLIRAHTPGALTSPPALPILNQNLPGLPLAPAPSLRRRFKVEVKAQSIAYNDHLIDPFGLVYNLIGYAGPGEAWESISNEKTSEPLILRCRKGEWVEIEVINSIPDDLEAEPMAPALPHEEGGRVISARVSLHADMLRYKIGQDDGSNVGNNADSTIANQSSRTYLWYADEELGPVLLQDFADFRNHRHHGLIGALIVEPAGSTPYKVADGSATAVISEENERWYGARATIKNGGISTLPLPTGLNSTKEEMVLLIQDGLRYFLYGNPALPIGDFPADPGEDAPDTEDQGLKGVNYRSEPSSHLRGYAYTPRTPLIVVPVNAEVCIHLLGGNDKPRNHSFTIHGHSWQEYNYLEADSPQVAAESGISCGSVSTYRFKANAKPGDYMYRSGVLKFVVEQGLWGILRVK